MKTRKQIMLDRKLHHTCVARILHVFTFVELLVTRFETTKNNPITSTGAKNNLKPIVFEMQRDTHELFECSCSPMRSLYLGSRALNSRIDTLDRGSAGANPRFPRRLAREDNCASL